MIMSSYDINCQYIKKLPRRLKDQFAPDKLQAFKSIQTAELPPVVVAGIGKYHAPMHTAECRPFFSLNNLPGAGDNFGENAEQKWADIEGISRATKEMAPGHRHDRLNNQNSDANTKLVHGMGKFKFNHGRLTNPDMCEKSTIWSTSTRPQSNASQMLKNTSLRSNNPSRTRTSSARGSWSTTSGRRTWSMLLTMPA